MDTEAFDATLAGAGVGHLPTIRRVLGYGSAARIALGEIALGEIALGEGPIIIYP